MDGNTVLTITTTLTQLADIRIALGYAIDIATDPEAKKALQTTYTRFCMLMLDAVEEE